MGRRKAEVNQKIFDIIRKYNASASDTSINTYTANIEKLLKELNGDTNEPDVSLFEDFDNVIKVLDSQKLSLNTYKNKLSSVITFLLANGTKKNIVDKFSKKVDELGSKIERENSKMNWNEKEKENVVSIKALKEYLDIMGSKLPPNPNKYDEYNKWMMYLSGMFQLNYPLRNELSDLQIYSKSEYDKLKNADTDYNYLILSKNEAKVILNKYKTKKTYGQIEFNIDEDYLVNGFNKYYNSIKKNIPEKYFNHWFLFKHNFEPMNRNEYTKLMNKTFEGTGKKISTSLIRKLVVSELYPVEKMKKLSSIMGHSIKTAINDYARD
jgi:hypothetical protein